jgi:ABC-2 type transport system ATP-binding protein
MMMRLAFSVAVNVDPDILVIDEVLAVGDQPFASKCAERILRFPPQRENPALCFSFTGDCRTVVRPRHLV